MTDKIIPLADIRYASRVPLVPAELLAPTGLLADTLARPLRDLRISVTDRCNFRCSYCMPREVFDKDYAFLPQSSLLSEPLLRKHLEVLIGMLAKIQTPSGQPLDITLTTNASLLAKKAQSLKDAGLQRITVSLDGLDDAVFRRMNDVDFPVADVLKGIEEAQRVGLAPIKVNMVVKRGTNDAEILPMARHFRNSGVVLRFIEYMDVGATNGWRMDEVLPSAQVIERLQAEFPLSAIDPNYRGETAERWRYADGAGEVGVISSVTHAFCGGCNRARLSTEGKLFLCLFASQGHDLRALLRGDFSDAQIAGAVAHIWQNRGDRYSELRAALPADTTPGEGLKRVEMSYIGG